MRLSHERSSKKKSFIVSAAMVNPGPFDDMSPDADMSDLTDMMDMPVDSEPDFTVNPAPIDMSIEQSMDMLNDMKNDG